MRDHVVGSGARLNQLKVINDEQREPVLGLQAPAHRTHLQNVGAGRVVYEQRRARELVEGVLDEFEVAVLGQPPGAQAPQRYARLRADEAVHHLLAAHFEREQSHGNFGGHCHVAGDIEGERGFAQRRPRADDHEVRTLETREDVVEVAKAGGKSAQRALAAVELFDAFVGGRKFVAHGREALRNGALRNREDARFDIVEDVFEVVAGGKGALGYFGGGADEIAQNFLLAHDFCVVLDVGGGRNTANELGEVARAAHGFKHAIFGKPRGERQDVYRLTFFVKGEDSAVDVRVRRFIEVAGVERVGNLDNSVFVDHQGTQNR